MTRQDMIGCVRDWTDPKAEDKWLDHASIHVVKGAVERIYTFDFEEDAEAFKTLMLKNVHEPEKD